MGSGVSKERWVTEVSDRFPSGADVYIVKPSDDESHVYARVESNNYRGYKTLMKGVSGEDDGKVIQAGLDYIEQIGGGKVVIGSGEYINISMLIDFNNNENILISGYGAKLIGNGKDAIITINTSQNYMGTILIEGFVIKSKENLKREDGVLIVDSSRNVIKNCLFDHLCNGVVFRLKDTWCEGNNIINTHFERCDIGIRTENVGSEYNACAKMLLECDVNKCDVGVYIGKGTSIMRSIGNMVIWLDDNQTGIYINGDFNYNDIFCTIESFSNTGTIGINIDEYASNSVIFNGRLVGDFNVKINNKYNKQVIIKQLDKIVVDDVWTNVFTITDDAGNNILSIVATAYGYPVIYTYAKKLSIYDSVYGKNSDVQLGRLIMTNIYSADYGGSFANFTPPAPAKGMMFLAEDTNATAPGKRLYICVDGTTWNYVDLS